MRRKPRPQSEGLFSGGVGPSMIVQGLFMGLLILASYFFGEYIEHGSFSFGQSADGMTMAFLTTNFVEMFRAFCARSLDGSIFAMKTTNRWLWVAFAWTFFLTCGVIFVPFFRGLFGFTTIDFKEFAIALGLAFTIVPASELVKLIRRRRTAKIAV